MARGQKRIEGQWLNKLTAHAVVGGGNLPLVADGGDHRRDRTNDASPGEA